MTTPSNTAEHGARQVPRAGAEPPRIAGSAFAAKADDLDAISRAVVDAAGVSAGLWLSYLFALFYLLVAAGGISHRDLLLSNTIKLPFLSVELPLQGFSVLGPVIFIVVHAYVLLHFALLASKVGLYDEELRRQIGNEAVRTQLRRQLPINIFVQFLAGPGEVRLGSMRFLLHLIAWTSLVIGPIGLLVFFVLQFLPLNDALVSWVQRIAVVTDLLLLWTLWPKIVSRTGGWIMAPVAGALMITVSVVPVVLVFAVATFSGEWLSRVFPRSPLRAALVGGSYDLTLGRQETPWSDHLVLVSFDAIDVGKYDSDAKLAAGPPPATLQGRHFDNAFLREAVLKRVNLAGASLTGAHLEYAQLQGANLNHAGLSGAFLVGAKLAGATLEGARLIGANLDSAQLQDANLRGADLRGAKLIKAQLQGADLTGATLQGALLDSAQLQGAMLDGATLDGAILDGAQLQGASLAGATMASASLQRVYAWRTDAAGAVAPGALVDAVTGDRRGCDHSPDCEWGDALTGLRQLLERSIIDPGNKDRAVQRLEQRLGSGTAAVEADATTAKAWSALAVPRPPARDFDRAFARMWLLTVCAPDGSPFMVAGLTGIVTLRLPLFDRHGGLAGALARDLLHARCEGAGAATDDLREQLRLVVRDRVEQSPAVSH